MAQKITKPWNEAKVFSPGDQLSFGRLEKKKNSFDQT